MFTLFPPYTFFQSDLTDEHPNYGDEHVSYPTLSWTSFYHFTNTISLPLFNTPNDNKQYSIQLYLLTTALTPKQFTKIGYEQSLIRFTAPKTNEYSIDHYDQHIQRPNEDTFLNDDKFANPQLTQKIFIKTPYVFTFKNLDKKHDHVISAALRDIQAYDSYFNKFNKFALTFNFLTPKERDLHCSHNIMLRTKQTHTYTTALQIHRRYQYINSKYTSPFFLNFTYCIKDTNL